jgi:hypothetical protein
LAQVALIGIKSGIGAAVCPLIQINAWGDRVQHKVRPDCH